MDLIKSAIPAENTILHKLKGYNDSASFSFMEGETTIGMLKKYGHYRMEFNLNGCVDIGLFGGLVDCEYVPQNRLKDYANDYCMLIRNKLDEIQKYNKEDCISLILASLDITSFIELEMDVLAKVFSIKEVEWREEKEWRLIDSLEDNKSNVCYTADGKPYINKNFPKRALTGITIFYNNDKAKALVDKESVYMYERYVVILFIKLFAIRQFSV